MGDVVVWSGDDGARKKARKIKGKNKADQEEADKGKGQVKSVNSVEDLVSAGKVLVNRGRRWVEHDPPRRILGIAAILFLIIWLTRRPGGASSELAGNLRMSHSGGGETAFDTEGYGGGGGDDEGEEEPKATKAKAEPKGGPNSEEFAAALAKETGLIHPPERAVKADQFSIRLPSWEVERDGSLICRDKGGGNNNKVCSKSYAEYRFKVPAAGAYYLYVETIAPNINDNSLWVGAPGLPPASFAECPSLKAGPLVPHKHIQSKKWLCCPKYLASNAKKNQGKFYCDCCTESIGPQGKDLGCILDLEVSTTPQWNMLPRKFDVQSTSEPLVVRLFAREDGTRVTRVIVSANPGLAASSIS